MTRDEAETLLYREALALDRRDWDAWLAMLAEDVVFWIPAWRDEVTPTEDPDRELSLIYYQGKPNLVDRVWRVRSGLSVASTPLPRVVHGIGNVLVERAHDSGVEVSSTYTVHRFDVRSGNSHVFFGRYEHLFRREGEQWVIARKKILLLNDVIPTVLDFYSI